MNWDQVEGKWKEFKGKVQERWGELTDDELDQAKGNREQVEGLIQQKYGKTKEQAREELDRWMREDA
ncbi:MAG: CsbD family protein [Sedimentitalea sp.]|nr:CsbD family protein [Sedimentitalea sp.]